jgi:UDP-glucose 6-dehydrogenase
MTNNSVVIGGLGVVGAQTCRAFGIKDYIDLKGSTLSWGEASKSKRYIFIAVPTPALLDGGHDTSIIRDSIENIQKVDKRIEHIFVVRSTTTPGQLEGLRDLLGIKIVHFPEFLTMSTAQEDTDWPDIIVLGGEKDEVAEIRGMCDSRWKGIPVFEGSLASSQLIKCAINNFYALKVVFANEIYDIAKQCGADYGLVKQAMYARKWVGKNHLDVIFNGKRGVRGPCLPKELQAMAFKYNSLLLLAAFRENEEIVKNEI